METSEEWIQQRTGIRERRYVDGDIGAADLGAIAAREALERAGPPAAVLPAEPDRARGILSTHLHAEGKYAEKLWLEAAASRSRPRLSPDMLEGAKPRIFPHMDGKYVFKHAVTRFPEVILEALSAHGYSVKDLDLLIPHQANLRISQMVAMGLELREEQMFNNIDRYG